MTHPYAEDNMILQTVELHKTAMFIVSVSFWMLFELRYTQTMLFVFFFVSLASGL